MRRIFLFVLYLFIQTSLFAQIGRNSVWFHASAKAGIGNSVLLNDNIKEDPKVTSHFVNPGSLFGARLGFSFNNDLSFSVEGLSNRIQQKYHIRPEQNATYIKKVNLNYYDFAVLFRYSSLSAVYFEIGPGMSLLADASASNTPPYPDQDDLKEKYSSELIKRAVAGIGLIIYSSYDDRFRVNAGARFNYYFDGIMANSNQAPSCDDYYNCHYNTEKDTYPFTAYFMLELDYFFGYYGKAGCGRPRFVIFKNPRSR